MKLTKTLLVLTVVFIFALVGLQFYVVYHESRSSESEEEDSTEETAAEN